MTLIEQLKADLGSGFSNRQLEYLIGLPQNSLSNIISGKKQLSKKSALKVERFMNSKKPDPLTVEIPKKKIVLHDLTKPNKIVKPITDKPDNTNRTISTMPDPKKDRLAYSKWLRENS